MPPSIDRQVAYETPDVAFGTELSFIILLQTNLQEAMV